MSTDEGVVCRLCGQRVEDASQLLSLTKANAKEFSNWTAYTFNAQDDLKKEGFPMKACKKCVDTAKTLHGFASKCCELNNIKFPKQEWWKKLEK